MRAPRFRTLRHTADLRIAVWGGNEQELIGNAVAAAMAAVLPGCGAGGSRRWTAVRPWPSDLASRIVRAVNEALFRVYVKREIVVGFEATAHGARLAVAPLPQGSAPALEVKAATYHRLEPNRRRGRLGVRLTLDV